MIENTLELRFPAEFWRRLGRLGEGYAYSVCKIPPGVVLVSADENGIKFSYPFGKEFVTTYGRDGVLEYQMRDAPMPTVTFGVASHAP